MDGLARADKMVRDDAMAVLRAGQLPQQASAAWI